MFEYEGKPYSLEALQKSATSQGYNFEEFMQMYKDAGMTGDFSVLKESGSSAQPENINPETGKEYTFMEMASNIFEPNIPSIFNLGNQFAQTGVIAIDKMFKTAIPKDGMLSDFIEKAAKSSGLMIKPEEAVDFDSGTLIDQLLYVGGDYDGEVKFRLTEEEKKTMSKIAEDKIDVMGVAIAKEQETIDERLKGKGGYTGEGFFNSNVQDKVLASINAINGVVMTVVPAMLTQGKSLGPQIVLPMISNYNKEKAKFLYGEDDPDALVKLGEDDGFELATPAVLGYIAYALEKLQFKGITNYITKQAFKPNRFVKLFQTGQINGVQEAFQGVVESLNMRLAKGETRTEALGNTFSDDLFSEEFFENYMLGVVGGTGISAGGATITRALKADKPTSLKVSEFVDTLSGLKQLKAKTQDTTTLEKIEKKIKETEEAFKDYINQNNNLSEYLTEEQEVELKSILESKDQNEKDLENLFKNLRAKKISKEEFDLAYKEIIVEQSENDATITQIKTDANTSLLKKDLDEQGKFVGDIDGLEIEDYDTQNEFFEALEKEYNKIGKKMPNYKESNILINGIKVGNKFLVNNQVAAETNATGVGVHEIIHGVVKSTLQEDDGSGNLSAKGEKMVKSFINQLSAKELKLIEDELAGGKYKTNKNGTEKEFKEYGEEYVTIYTQLLKEGRFGKNGLQKFGSWFSNILNKETPFKKISFGDGESIKSFLDAFVKGDVVALEQAKELAKEGVGMKETVEQSKSAVNLDEGKGDISQKIDSYTRGAKTKEDLKVRNPGEKTSAFDDIYSGIVQGKFDRVFGENITSKQKEKQRESLADRFSGLTKEGGFDPSKTPELSKWMYGSKKPGKGGNIGYSALTAKDRLFKANEKAKKETPIDTKEAREIEDTTTPIAPTETTEADKKDVKLRKLKDFNVELDSGLADALTIEEVNSLLNDLAADKITFKQAKVKMDELVAKDIRAALSEIIPKIAKNEKTGKREPTPKYESFIRNEYNEVVQSLGIKTIRTAYKKWFKQEKTGKKDYTNIDPVTGVVSNFVKDTQENTTNKREYIRWFLEGKPGDLTERRTALIRRIAKRKASLAVDNYIAENSNNIDVKLLAFMSTLSDNAENATNEQVSFDSVKFSKSLNKNDARINRAMEKNGLYKAPDGTIMTFAKRKNGTWDKGRVFEQAMNETLQEVVKNIKGVSISGEVATEEGGRADIVIEYTDGTKLKVENHEIKKGLSAFMGSVLISELNLQNGKYTLANSIHDNIKGLDSLMKDVVKNLKEKVNIINKEIDIYNEKYGYKKGDVEFADQITGNVVKGKPESMPLEVYNKVGKKLGTLKAGVEVIANHYKGKTIKIDGEKIKAPVKSISLFGYGSFRIDPSSIFKGLPMLDVATEVYASIRYGKGETKGSKDFVTFKPGLQFRLDGKPKNESNSGLYTEQAVMQALNMPAFAKSVGKAKVLDNAIKASRTISDPKGITILDFDDTLATTKSLVKYTTPDGETGTLNAEEYASTYEDLQDQGYTFDFSDFNKVVKGKLAPLFQKALKLQNKFGPESMFVLTARPPQAAKAIFDFLKANGLNIPVKNITGLGNSTAEAKALWVADKVGEGFNDFYFADDALQNTQAVKNMLEQFDVKSKVQQARVKFSKSMNKDFNKILEDVTDIDAKKRFSAVKARKRGESKGKFRFFIPPSHEDFVGLLYNFLGKGKEGNAHRDFFEQALIRPLNRANREYDTARQSVANDYKALNKQFEDVRKKLTKKTPDGDFTFQDAIRVYLWNKHGHKIPGLSPTDQQNLVDLVTSDTELQTYAETLNVISKQETYVTPTDGWNSGDIRIDLDDATGRIGRKQFFGEFIENAEVIFSEENLNKIEAGYGKSVRESLEDMLYRIKTGRNRPTGQNEQVNKLMNYLNGSVGTVMFFNMRSALLQQMSIVNYINFADNNIFAAAKAFANQKQYWADWAFIFNSDMLKQRRGGIQTDVNGAELAASLRNSKDVTRKLISKLLELGFLPTQIGDNIAIATGGSTYYRNRINKYIKQGLSQKEAEAKAFTDFQAITQSTQQSARPDMVSKQQASVIGKVILNFQNVTSQFNRLGKKAFQDIYNRRITGPNTTQVQSDISNAARITYYFAIQNAIFYTLQTALFAMMFDDDEEDDNKLFLKKKERLINGSIDSVLRGTGLIGGVVATLKNVAIAFARQRDVRYNPDESAVALEALNLSPVLGIKIRKIVNAEKTLNYNKKVIDEMSDFDIDNPQWSAATNYTEAITNIPLNRLYNKTQNVRQALNNEHAAWERTLMFLGWSQYNLDLENKKMDDIKESVKSKKKKKKKKKSSKKIKVYPSY